MDETLTEVAPAAPEREGRSLSEWWAAARATLVARRAEVFAALLLVSMGANLLSVLPRKSLTNDELYHIPAGYYHLVGGMFELNNEHPPLAKMWAALPLLFVQPDEPPPPKDQTENNMNLTWGYLQRFFADNQERLPAVIFWPRVFAVLLTLALGALTFIYARRFFGARAGVLAVALYSLEPTLLAHGRIVHTDVPAAFVYLLFFLVLHNYLRARTTKRALLVGLATGAAFCTKFSMVVLPALVAALAVAGFALAPRLKMRRARVALHFAVVFVTVLLVVNAAYYFQRPPVREADVGWVRLQSPESADALLKTFRVGAKVLPTYFMFGFYNVALHNRDGHPSSLLGEYRTEGWWYYFPVAFALKTTLPFLLLTVAALAWALWRLGARRDLRYLAVLAPLAVYLALSMSSRINIGIRHLLPAFPFLFVAGGALLDRLLEVKRARLAALALVALTFGWTALEAWRAYPDYVPYMNQLASTHPRWWYLSDSNVEWGDDVQALAA
ncbi:MAG TPA: glycosyltransferase family 39 protein, partial [Pyrinomonadaceae bacterium]|nr:glycosyltransferase family 39 protein [Pyrinomonadaceae bacterium]